MLKIIATMCSGVIILLDIPWDGQSINSWEHYYMSYGLSGRFAVW